ncbi:MarR family winged helix-turn-helix transcriptional regulator [Variovorax sp. DAIF25]|jgi:DNA-binding MarR family transcriptional regulator|uniref:MarR family winged helix-turn-helix transcriptional regulator n=1 Tax=Variovorax sp. DAIF25 TaxID=3080983 RepID=UPI003D6C3710
MPSKESASPLPRDAASVQPDGILRLNDWLPYQCSVITNRVSGMLARMYSEELGIGVVEWRVLANLVAFSPMSATELSESTAMDKVSITRALNLLVTKKLVSRRVDAKDRRKVVLRLTKTGADAYERVMPLARAIEQELTSALTPQELKTVQAAMQVLVARANAALDDTRDWRELAPADTVPAAAAV